MGWGRRGKDIVRVYVLYVCGGGRKARLWHAEECSQYAAPIYGVRSRVQAGAKAYTTTYGTEEEVGHVGRGSWLVACGRTMLIRQ